MDSTIGLAPFPIEAPLGAATLGKAGLGSMLVRNLRRAGLAHEAARTLTQQTRNTFDPTCGPLFDLWKQAGLRQRAPTREEVDSKVAEAQQKLAELKRAQEDLERERSALEEVRRRQMEFQNGRKEGRCQGEWRGRQDQVSPRQLV